MNLDQILQSHFTPTQESYFMSCLFALAQLVLYAADEQYKLSSYLIRKSPYLNYIRLATNITKMVWYTFIAIASNQNECGKNAIF